MAHIDIGQDSVLKLYSGIPISAGQQIAFSSVTNQNAYFAKKLIHTYNNLSYVYRNGVIKIQDAITVVPNADYISFTNPSFENKTIYARIIDYRYINNATVEIKYSVDWFQTFMFDVTYEACSIVREQLSVDGYDKAKANPYRRDIPELLSDEGLPISKELEKIYEVGSEMFFKPTSQNVTIQNGRYIGAGKAPTTDNMDEPYMIFLMSSVDVDILNDSSNTWDNLMGRFNYMSGDTSDDFGSVSNGFPRSVKILGHPLKDIMTNVDGSSLFTDFINYLTANGISSSLVGCYVIPFWVLASDANGIYPNDSIIGGFPEDNVLSVNINASDYIDDTLKNPKLNTFPFKYIRVESPDGNIKEYNFSKFDLVNKGFSKANFSLIGNLNGIPIMTVVPYSYNYVSSGGVGDSYFKDLNFSERIDFDRFCQAGFSTDAYLTFLSSQYSSTVGSRTMSTDMLMHGNTINNIGSAAFSGMSGSPSAIFSSANNVTQDLIKNKEYYKVLDEAKASRNVQSDDWSDVAKGDVVSQVYNEARPAFACDSYKTGSTGGYLAYMNPNGLKFRFTIVDLDPNIKQEYDKFLTCYGYTCNYVDVPRICNFIKGVTEVDKIPKFLDFNGEEITYIKTEKSHIISNMEVVSSYLEAMFDAGVRMLNGNVLN